MQSFQNFLKISTTSGSKHFEEQILYTHTCVHRTSPEWVLLIEDDIRMMSSPLFNFQNIRAIRGP